MKIKPIAMLVGVAISSQAFALEEPITITTAARTAQTVDQSLASVTIITSEDIEASQAKSVQELISGHIGIDTTSRGGYGKNTSLFIRGTNSDHVLVLIDGMRVGSATLGTTELSQIPLAQIERIEIVRGPRSSLYGSEAIGGVIQIFTRQGQGGYRTHAEVTAGSNNFRQGSVSTSGNYGNSRYALGASKLRNDGFDAIDDGENDDDGYENRSVNLRFGHTYNNGLDMDLHLLNARGESDYDGAWSNEAKFDQENYGLNVNYPVLKQWVTKLSTARSEDDSKDYLDGNYVSNYNTKRQQVSWQNDITVSDGQTLTAGIDQLKDEVKGYYLAPVDYTEDQRTNTGLFFQFLGNTGQHDYQASLRRDRNTSFNTQNTGSLAYGYQLPSQTRLTASYGTAFKAPTFNDLYYPYTGNPDLKPQESRSAELGIHQDYADGNMELNVYKTEINELIEWQSDSQGNWSPVNIDVVIRGVELRYQTTLMGWTTNTELSWTDPRNKDSDNVMQLRSQHTARIDLSRDFGKANLNINAVTQGDRYADASNSAVLGGYAVINVAGAYQLTKQWSLHGRINNLVDKKYETVQDYNSPGRTFFVSLAYDLAN